MGRALGAATFTDPYGFDSPLFGCMCELFAARFAPSTLDDCFARIQSAGLNVHSPSAIFLPIESDVAQGIFNLHYERLLSGVCRSFRFVPAMSDVLISEMNAESLVIVSEFLDAARSACTVTAEPERNRFQIAGPELFTEMLLTPISQFHMEVVLHFRTLRRYVDLVDGDTSRLYSRPLASSSFSAFLEGWVTSQLGIPQNAGIDAKTIVAVI